MLSPWTGAVRYISSVVVVDRAAPTTVYTPRTLRGGCHTLSVFPLLSATRVRARCWCSASWHRSTRSRGGWATRGGWRARAPAAGQQRRPNANGRQPGQSELLSEPGAAHTQSHPSPLTHVGTAVRGVAAWAWAWACPGLQQLTSATTPVRTSSRHPRRVGPAPRRSRLAGTPPWRCLLLGSALGQPAEASRHARARTSRSRRRAAGAGAAAAQAEAPGSV